jgi:hypothetical protein
MCKPVAIETTAGKAIDTLLGVGILAETTGGH